MRHIKELMDNPLDWQSVYDDDNRYSAEFDLDNGLTYSLEAFLRHSYDITAIEVFRDLNITGTAWEIEFVAIEGFKHNYKVTGTGDQFTVFATIADIIKMFIFRRKPDAFFFSAKERSRVKLYRIFSQKLSKEFGYNVREGTLENSKDIYFVFERN